MLQLIYAYQKEKKIITKLKIITLQSKIMIYLKSIV